MKGICQICGLKKNLDKHHIDYLAEITLMICSQCHSKIHNLKREILKPRTEPLEVTCHKCNYKWKYRGFNPYYATCPQCYLKVKIFEDKTK